MSYGQQPRGYGQQSDLQVGMPVSSDNGWTGTITEIIPAAPGYESAVRVAWNGDGTTLVALAMFVVEQGQAVIRTQPPPPPAAPPTPEPAVSEDDFHTRLAGSAYPAQNDPSHVNPYVNDPPLVTTEPPPIRPTHGGQVHDDMTYIPPVPRPESSGETIPTDLEATYIPPRDTPYAPRQESSGATIPSDFEATYIPPRDMPAPEVRPFAEHGPEPTPYTPPYQREPTQPEAGLTTPLDAMNAPRPDTMMVEPEQREITVPIVEEQVEAHPEWRDSGSIAVRTVTEEVPQTLTQETQREELFVERVAIGRELAAGEEVAPHDDGDTYVIPVVVEEAVVVTRRILAEELRITKRVVPTMQTVQTVVRKERVEIDAGDLADRVHDASGTDATGDGGQAMRMDRPSGGSGQ